MDREEFAAMLNGRRIGEEITRNECKQARECGLVVVYGASDDLMEFDGAFRDTVGVYDGDEVYVNQKGVFESECSDEDCPYSEREMKKCKMIEAVWCESEDSPTWQHRTDIPHSTFDIAEDGEVYCRGIVFGLADL